MRRRRTPDDTGASAVEYALLAAAVAAVIVAIVFALGQNVFSLFDKTCQAIESKVDGTEEC
jgi:pilus assembly protein Flp/PilA